MVFCAVVGCSSNNNKKSKNYNSECRYFSFPKDKSVCDAWVHKCYQQHKFNIKTARICSKHFIDSDYCLRGKLLDYPRNKWKLKPDAIPSINLIKYPKPHTKRSERVIKRHLMKDVQEHENLNTNENEKEISTAGEEITLETHLKIYTNASTQTESSEDDSEKLQTLVRECAHLRDIVEKQRRELQSVEKIFTKGQLRKLKSAKQVKWYIEDIASAVSLYAGGPRSYRLLRKRGYPLPGVSTLKRWAGKIDVQPGILNIVLKLMEKSPLPKMERVCVLLFDEMKIQSAFDYDKKTDTTLGPSKYVQVVMARGICGHWKQPIFYNYDCKLTKKLLYDIIKKVENVGFPVYAINCDLGGSNRGLWSQLNISENQTWFENPANKKRIYVFADAPHMIKLLRNHFIDTGFMLPTKHFIRD